MMCYALLWNHVKQNDIKALQVIDYKHGLLWNHAKQNDIKAPHEQQGI